jgi:hypothetical protein
MAKAEFLIADALKAQQWERAKGELRALVALQGSYTSPYPDHVDKDADFFVGLWKTKTPER